MRNTNVNDDLLKSRLFFAFKLVAGFLGFVVVTGVVSKLAIELEGEPSDAHMDTSDENRLAVTRTESVGLFDALTFFGLAAAQLYGRSFANPNVVFPRDGSYTCGAEELISTYNDANPENPQMKTDERGNRVFIWTALGQSGFPRANMRVNDGKNQEWLASEFELGTSFILNSNQTERSDQSCGLSRVAYKGEGDIDFSQEFSRPALAETSGKVLATFQEELVVGSRPIGTNIASYRSLNQTELSLMGDSACTVNYSGSLQLGGEPVETNPTTYPTIDVASVVLKNRYDKANDFSYLEINVVDTEGVYAGVISIITSNNTYIHLAKPEQRAFTSTVTRLFNKLALAVWTQGVETGDKWGVSAQALSTKISPAKKGIEIDNYGDALTLVPPSSDSVTIPSVTAVDKEGLIENAFAVAWVEYKKETDSYIPKIKLGRKGDGNSFVVGEEFEIGSPQSDSIVSISVTWNAVNEKLIVTTNRGDGHGDGVLLTFIEIDKLDQLTLKYSHSAFANTCTQHNQSQGFVEVSPDGSGDFTAVWAGAGQGIVAQRFDAASNKIGFNGNKDDGGNETSDSNDSWTKEKIAEVSAGAAGGLLLLGGVGIFAYKRYNRRRNIVNRSEEHQLLQRENRV